MLAKLINLIGRSIQSDEIRTFFAENGVKYPKRDAISNRATERNFWVESKTLGINFLFTIEILNSKYTIAKGQRKGIFIPILSYITFEKNAQIDYPSQINHKSSLDYLYTTLGTPALVHKYALGVYHIWNLIQEASKDIIIQLYYNVDRNDLSIILRIDEKTELLGLYDPLLGETIEYLVENAMNSFYIKKSLFFMNWALHNDYLMIDKLAEVSLTQFKSGEIDIIEFVKENYANVNYIAKEDFVDAVVKFVYEYNKNASEYDVVYQNDFALAFLKDKKLRDNYLGRDAFDEIAKIEYSTENLNFISDIIDKRFKEHKEHGFSKSKRDLKM